MVEKLAVFNEPVIEVANTHSGNSSLSVKSKGTSDEIAVFEEPVIGMADTQSWSKGSSPSIKIKGTSDEKCQ